MDFSYCSYNHEVFRHLKFDVLDQWIINEGDLEVAFENIDESLPQLFFQTLGKNDNYNDGMSFYTFILDEDQTSRFTPCKEIECSKFTAFEYQYCEEKNPESYMYSLIVDVGEGLLWFCLEVPYKNHDHYKEIVNRLRQSIEFE